MHKLVFSLTFLFVALPQPTQAGECKVHFQNNNIITIKDEKLNFESNNLVLENGIYLFTGDVQVHQGKRIIKADSIAYDSIKRKVDAQNEVELLESNLSLKSDSANIDVQQRTAKLQNVLYKIPQQHGHGKAQSIAIESQSSISLRKAYYTTCDPNKEHWKIHAAKMYFDNDKQSGSATHIVLWLGKIPVFYFPYIQFPIGDKRKSGFLAPRIKLRDSSSGGGFSLPYYINIAPNKDATITPRFLTRRGLQFLNEVRYLNKFSHSTMLFDYLPNDKLFGSDRSFNSFRSSGGIRKKVAFDIHYNQVSDSNYFIDLGNSLYSSNVAHLERKADIQFKSGNLSIFMRGQKYQTLDQTIPTTSRPYQRLPQLQINYSTSYPILFSQFHTEFVSFKRAGAVSSLRTHLAPSIGLNLQKSYGFIKPRIHYYYTQYHNKELGNQYDLERRMPSYQLNSGLFFDRDSIWHKKPILQTLEPRLSFLKTPYHNQGNIPVFDTSRLDDNFNNIFLANRYAGIDRIGDTEQIALGLIHRWIDQDTGVQDLRFELGHIYYLRDRLVGLPTETNQTDPESAWLSSTQINLSTNSQLNAEYVWDPNNNSSLRSMAMLRVKDKRRRFSLSYRKEANKLEQVSLLANGKFATSWQYTGQLVYDLNQNQNLEWWGGLEYSSCCWSFRFAKRSFINGSGIKDQHLLLEFELQGMSKVGEKLSEMFQY